MQKKNGKKIKQKVLLDKNITPLEYNIKLHPDLENFTFAGVEIISLNILKPTKSLTLHSKEIEINTASIVVNKEKLFAKISYNTKAETATFIFPKIIKKGKAKLTIVFKGILNDKMRGFYRSSYIYEGKVHNMATTQFEATDARRAFPCFDEPAQKAIFHVSLVVPKGKTAISNTLPISKIQHEAGLEVIKFAPSPKMSTYLLAFIVGDFEYIEKKSKRGVMVRVYTVPGKIHQAKFALETTVKCLDFYEEYFDIPYPLNTLDMIAIPDFSSGAMENWGAITYRETALLFDEEKSSIANKQWVALVIAHELAHQWFGNLVTMEWWTHLWLNEGFASYIEYLAVDKLFPNWDIWTQFATHDLSIALSLDALANTHPIEVTVHHPDEIGEIFDAVSYSKGASVIRMLAEYLGPENFRNGLRYYLKKHSYKNTETVHLWEAFEKISKKEVKKMMHGWTSQSGYPVVKVEVKNNTLMLSQERFFASPVSRKNNKKKTIWEIPVSVNLSKVQFLRSIAQADAPSIAKNQQIFMSAEKKLVPSKNLEGNFIKINSNETSFFRTAYSHELLELLKDPVANKTFPPLDRLGIVRDLFALSEAGIIPTNYVLEFLPSYKDEDEYTVWAEISSGLGYMSQILAKSKIKSDFDIFVCDLFANIFNKVGFEKKENEKHTTPLLRQLILRRLVQHEHKVVIKELLKKYKDLENGKKIDPDLRGLLYSTYAKMGGEKEYKKLIQKYKKETLHEEKNRIGSAISQSTQDKVLCEVVHFALSDDVRIQDTVSILSSVGINPLGRNIWLKCLKTNWQIFLTRYGDGGMALSYVVKGISMSPEKKHLEEYKKFFSKNKAPGAERAVAQTIEKMEANILYLSRELPNLQKFLKNWGK